MPLSNPGYQYSPNFPDVLFSIFVSYSDVFIFKFHFIGCFFKWDFRLVLLFTVDADVEIVHKQARMVHMSLSSPFVGITYSNAVDCTQLTTL